MPTDRSAPHEEIKVTDNVEKPIRAATPPEKLVELKEVDLKDLPVEDDAVKGGGGCCDVP